MNIMSTIQRIRNLKKIRREHIENPIVVCPHCRGACVCVICTDFIRNGMIEKLELQLLEAADD